MFPSHIQLRRAPPHAPPFFARWYQQQVGRTPAASSAHAQVGRGNPRCLGALLPSHCLASASTDTRPYAAECYSSRSAQPSRNPHSYPSLAQGIPYVLGYLGSVGSSAESLARCTAPPLPVVGFVDDGERSSAVNPTTEQKPLHEMRGCGAVTPRGGDACLRVERRDIVNMRNWARAIHVDSCGCPRVGRGCT
jgi:hypothetical protein